MKPRHHGFVRRVFAFSDHRIDAREATTAGGEWRYDLAMSKLLLAAISPLAAATALAQACDQGEARGCDRISYQD